MPLFALSLLFTSPAPLDMPRAQAFLVRGDGASRLEDRYDRLDLWVSQTVVGRWVDDAFRQFELSRLDTCPPAVDWDVTLTRTDFADERVTMPRVKTNGGFPPSFKEAVALLAPCGVLATPRAPRQLTRGCKEIYYWQNPTNFTDVVCTFLPEESKTWYLATWSLAEGDDFGAQMEAFEDTFLRKEFVAFQQAREAEAAASPRKPSQADERKGRLSERELLRADARHSIAAYPNWRFTDAAEFAVLDDLPGRDFVQALTNDLSVMRAKYAAAMPTPLDGSNVLCVARIYASRGEYLEALETEGITNMSWSAAYWCSQRRELVAYLPTSGEGELLKTIRHEAFHQYLSYAASMIETSPWLNEGYAQYFEDEDSDAWGAEFDVSDEGINRLADALPGILSMDYRQFYDGTDAERRCKYRLAWSVANFLEKGADQVRLKPFKGLKRRYFEALLETKDMHLATAGAFKDKDTLKHFVAEWKKYWKAK